MKRSAKKISAKVPETKPLIPSPKRQLAKEVKRPDGAAAYRLEGTTIRYWLTEAKAAELNSDPVTRHGKWRPDPAAFADQVKEFRPKGMTYAEWRRRLSAGYELDNIWFEQINRAKSAQENVMSKDKSTKSEKSSKPEKTNKSGGKKHQEWNGLGMCEIIRYCGSKKFSKSKTMKIVESLGFDANPATVSIQMRKGRLDENVPTLSKDQRGEFNAIADDVPNDEPKASKKSSKKASGKSGKKSSKITKKHKTEDDEAEEQAAQDAAEEDEEEVEETEEVEVEV